MQVYIVWICLDWRDNYATALDGIFTTYKEAHQTAEALWTHYEGKYEIFIKKHTCGDRQPLSKVPTIWEKREVGA